MALIPRKSRSRGPGRELSPIGALRTEMDRLFDSFLREPFGGFDWPSGWSGKWSPAVDVSEDDKEVVVRAELPGIDPKDLDVSVVGNQITLRGEKRESTERQEKGFRQTETRYGSFHRTISLPEEVDTEKVDAQYANGVLTLRLAKTVPAAAKRIEVKVKQG
jgi:HSP20 family protein